MSSSLSTLRAHHDSQNLHDALRAFPGHCREGWTAGLAVAGPRPQPSAILICGMGGSAISGDLLRGLMASRAPLPVLVHRNYGLPAWVDASTLVVILSYSGGTEESLSAFATARERGASLLAVTTGGTLGRLAAEAALPVVTIPAGLPPRYALGYLFFGLLGAMQTWGLCTLPEGEREEALALIEDTVGRLASEEDDNPALAIARDLVGTLPVIYAGDDTLGAVAYRWRCQFNENAKVLALHHVVPEMNHNEIVGWENYPERLKNCAVLALRDAGDHPSVSTRIDISLDIIRPLAGRVFELRSTAHHPLGRLLELLCLGDWVSYWLALLLATDPFPIANIDTLKRALAPR